MSVALDHGRDRLWHSGCVVEDWTPLRALPLFLGDLPNRRTFAISRSAIRTWAYLWEATIQPITGPFHVPSIVLSV